MNMKSTFLKLFVLSGFVLSFASCSQTKHNFASEWSHDEQKHWHVCLDEGFEDLKGDEASHSFTSVVTPETDTSFEYTTYTCDVCGYSYVEEKEYVNAQGLEFLLLDNDTYSVRIGTATELSNIKIPSKYNGKPVSQIYESGFNGSQKLKHIHLPDTLTKINNYAFRNCSLLEDISIPNSVTEMGINIFENCTSLATANIPNKLKILDHCIFMGCTKLTEITIPDTVTTLRDSVFERTGITSIEFPKSVKTIGERVFQRCTSLVSIKMHDSVESVGVDTCAYCTKLEYVDIVLSNYSNFLKMTGKDNLYRTYDTFKSMRLFDADNHEITEVVIPSGIKSISDDAFAYFRNITSVSLPNGVTSIGATAFNECVKMTSIELPTSLRTIDYGAFAGSGLTSITIPEGVTSIGNFCFSNCYDLTSISIPSTLASIGDNFLYNCILLSSIEVSQNSNYFKIVDGLLLTKNDQEIVRCVPSKEGVVNAPAGLIKVRESAFNYCKSVTQINLPDTVTSIGAAAFQACFKLESFSFPSSWVETSIKQYMFNNCRALRSIIIPDQVTSIDAYAFSNCSSLESIILPSNVSLVADYAFTNCSSLRWIVIEKPSTNPFYEVTNTRPSYYIDHSKNALKGCTSLEYIFAKNSFEVYVDDHYLYSYIYSENEPTSQGQYWQYVDGVPTVWGN